MTECPHCHAVLPQPPQRFCPSCGIDLGPDGGAETYVPPSPVPPYGGAPPPYPPPLPGGYDAGGSGLPPGYGAPPGGSNPWERRRQTGLLTALIDTTKQVLTQPAAFFRNMPVTGGLVSPMIYAVITGYIGFAAATIYNTVFNSVLTSSLTRISGSSELERLAPYLEGTTALLGYLIFGPVFIVIGLFIGAGLFHLVLLAFGGGTRGFEATFRVAAFSQAASIFGIIPMCGGFISLVYTLTLLVIGLSEAHQISRGKAAAAALVPFVLTCCCCLVVVLAVAFGIAGMLGNLR